jgi:hypothetical protein
MLCPSSGQSELGESVFMYVCMGFVQQTHGMKVGGRVWSLSKTMAMFEKEILSEEPILGLPSAPKVQY